MKENPLLKKLNLKDQSPVLIMNHPKAYQAIIDTINAAVHLQPKRKYNFVHLFVKNRAELGNYAEKAANSLDDDGYFWISYPKKSSKKYSSDISRDVGWEVLGQLNFEPVTQVSINEDWSALRFRRVEHIKTMTRKKAISARGRQRISKRK